MSALPAGGNGHRALLGNAAVLLLLVALGYALARWHTGDWWLAAPRAPRWYGAGLALLLYAGFCGLLWRHAARQARAVQRAAAAASADAVLVVHASQTGFAAELAAMTAASLQGAGIAAQVQDIGQVKPERLQAGGRVLFVASTTGEGDPPDPALGFVRNAMAQSPDLRRLHYAVLALGDREYQQFCAFGHRLDDWLRRNGAQPLFDRVDVDNADESALRHWQHHLGQLAGSTDLPDWSPPRYEDWRLAGRIELNPGSAGGPAFHIALAPPAGAAPDWQPGNIAEIGPRHARGDVAAWLEAAHHRGGEPVQWQDQRTTLADALARSQLPSAAESRGLPAQALADTLRPLPHREYSIASLPADGALHLLVRLMARDDGTPGLGSGWLCLHAALGDTIAVRIRRNPGFHPPAVDVPLILIGNGTGLAGLRAHLKARVAAGARRNWLLFGERNADRDFFLRDEIEAWRAQGFLPQVDVVFSRDRAERRYVQHALRERAAELRQWVEDGAAIYVCGSLAGMAPGVDAALREALGDAKVEEMLAEGRYRRDVY